MPKETISNKQALNIAYSIQCMLKELERMAAKSLAEMADEEEKDNIYVKISPSSVERMIIEFQVLNTLTKTTVIKRHDLIELLRSLNDIFLVNSIVENDMKKLYKKSKEIVFNHNTKVYI